MKFWNLFFLFFGFTIIGSGQTNTMTSKSDNDPKAKAVLDKLKKQFDTYKSMELNFEFQLELPGKPVETQKGKLIQDGVKYAIVMKDQEIYADGKNTWLYLKNKKEVQISDFDDSGSDAFLSPKQMLSLYQSGDYVYSIMEERKVGKTVFSDIEFKPLKKNTDFTKLRLTVDKTSNSMVSLRVFLRDGSRYLLKMDSLNPNKKYAPETFVLNSKELKGVHIEDLRMD
jgi:outer membrane lipoprotein-sorting protein